MRKRLQQECYSVAIRWLLETALQTVPNARASFPLRQAKRIADMDIILAQLFDKYIVYSFLDEKKINWDKKKKQETIWSKIKKNELKYDGKHGSWIFLWRKRTIHAQQKISGRSDPVITIWYFYRPISVPIWMQVENIIALWKHDRRSCKPGKVAISPLLIYLL